MITAWKELEGKSGDDDGGDDFFYFLLLFPLANKLRVNNKTPNTWTDLTGLIRSLFCRASRHEEGTVLTPTTEGAEINRAQSGSTNG
jgi:hypothetical protein